MADARAEKDSSNKNTWKLVAIVCAIACLLLAVALVVTLILTLQELDEERAASSGSPCPRQDGGGGLLTSGDPDVPGPFHDLTLAEYSRLYAFLRSRKDLNIEPPETAAIGTSNIYIVDLQVPPKREVLSFLDNEGPQPAREARVMIFRGDKNPPVIEEYVVGPLHKPSYVKLAESSQRRNPVPFSLRPKGNMESHAFDEYILPQVDREVGDILMESYGGRYEDCGDTCLFWNMFQIGTGLHGDINTRMQWIEAAYQAEFETLHPLDFAVLANVSGSDPTMWTIGLVWYSGNMYDSLQDLKHRYYNDPAVKKTRLKFLRTTKDLKSTLNLRGSPVPEKPQRPPVQVALKPALTPLFVCGSTYFSQTALSPGLPTLERLQVEPDGKRYSIRHRHVSYMNWEFDVRLSSLSGPQVYDVRYLGDRITYEVGLSEMSVFYSGNGPVQQVVDYVDAGELLGTHSKSLVPGVDCPEGATFLNASFLGEATDKPSTFGRAICVFELNTGVPLRRHLSYTSEDGSFYGGMADSVLTVRSILTVYNYDYVMDFIFRQNGALEIRAVSTGYILSTFHRPEEDPYGFRLDRNIVANLHQHLFHFKADVDIAGTSNRYETLDITRETVPLRQVTPTVTYYQTRFDRNLHQTENDAVYKFNFDTPKYHIVHNKNNKTEYGVPRAYRVQLTGLSKQLRPPNLNNEPSISWSRQQMAVTVHKEDERFGSSPYTMFDSKDPVTSFSNFISDESIVDKDLVFWITMGMQHIPHTEDLPLTPTVGNHVSFFLSPYNYFPECPSVSSRDQIRVEFATPEKPADGLQVKRNGNQVHGVCGAPTLEQLVTDRPNDFLLTGNDSSLL